MKIKHTKVAALASTLITFGSLTGGAEAAVIINFEELGGGVIATTSGSIVVPNTFANNFSGTVNATDPDTFLYATGSVDRYTGGTNPSVGPTIQANTASGSTFGFDVSSFYVAASTPVGSSYTPNTTWTWTSADLASIGLGSLDSTPTLAFTTSEGDTISFTATTVPEPSSAFLLGLGALGLVSRRKRSA